MATNGWGGDATFHDYECITNPAEKPSGASQTKKDQLCQATTLTTLTTMITIIIPWLNPHILKRGAFSQQFAHQKFSLRGRILYTPTPPPLKIPFKGWGAYKKGGRIKFLPRGGSGYTPPPPSPEKYLLSRNGGRGGGVYNFSLDSLLQKHYFVWGVSAVFDWEVEQLLDGQHFRNQRVLNLEACEMTTTLVTYNQICNIFQDLIVMDFPMEKAELLDDFTIFPLITTPI